MKIYVGCIDHRYGRNWYVAATEKELLAQVAAFCRQWWSEITLLDEEAIPKSDRAAIDRYFAAPKSDRAAIDRYFAARNDETWGYDCKDLELPSEVIAALRHSTTQLEDLANGWAHGELHEPLEQTIERNRALLSATGEGSED